MAKTLEEAMDDDVEITFKVADFGMLLEAIQFRMHTARYFIDMSNAPPPKEEVEPTVSGKIMFELLVHESLDAIGRKIAARFNELDVSS